MMKESADLIVRLLESPEPFDHHGEFWQFENRRLQLRSYQQPRLPLAIASSTEAARCWTWPRAIP